jgi:hypothetical protein
MRNKFHRTSMSVLRENITYLVQGLENTSVNKLRMLLDCSDSNDFQMSTENTRNRYNAWYLLKLFVQEISLVGLPVGLVFCRTACRVCAVWLTGMSSK